MATEFADEPPESRPPTGVTEIPSALTPRVPRGHPLIAWGVIIAALAGLFVLHQRFQPPVEVKELDTFDLQARYLVGAANLGPKSPALYDQAKDLDRGAAAQRLRFIVLAGELKDPNEALQRLDALKEQLNQSAVPDAGEPDAAVADVLGRLYHDYADGDMTAADVTTEQRQELQERLGWFGELALNPRGGADPAARAAVLAPALRSVVVTLAIFVAALGGGAVGFILLVLFAALWRQMRSRIAVGAPFGGVYAETFALWLIVYFGLSVVLGHFLSGLPLVVSAGLPQILSLAVVAWPVLRGVSWRQVRRDVGWVVGDRPILEPLCGILCYLAALPVVISLALAVAGLIQLGQKWGGHKLFGPDSAPTHPAVPLVLHGDWVQWIQIVFVAAVMAPILEETMFRGVLYRHLREATAGWRRWASVVVSALVAAFVFAALHPQGVLAIPLLMALACGFTAAREWRGSLIPSMTVHALHNGTLVLILILLAA